EAGRLDGRQQESILRESSCEPVLGSLFRPGNRRASRRHAADEPAVESGAAGRSGGAVREKRLRSQGPDARNLHQPGVWAFELAQSDKRKGQTELCAALSPAYGR